MAKTSTQIVLSVNDWNPSGIRYMQPKVNERGAKSINIISTQTNRSLHISTPLMMTWGISDFVDEKGESDGKFSMSLNFPNEDFATPATTDFLNKLKSFENQILDDAVKNSDVWFGESMSREVAKHTFFPFLKYTKDKMTKKFDYSKAPAIRGKVPNYNNKWAVEIYNTKGELIFPCDNEHMTPIDFVPKKSNVAVVLQCGGLWFGGKGWGITWKVNQIVVKPQETVSVFGKCHIQLSNDEMDKIEKQDIPHVPEDEIEGEIVSTPAAPAVVSEPRSVTEVEDSDTEDNVAVSAPEPVAVPTPEPPAKKIVKKVVAAVAPEVVESPAEAVVETAAAAAVTEPAKKKVLKKKV
jgi:hypothetical protein